MLNPEDAEVIVTCSIITTEANGIVGKIHDRMPVIIPLERMALWLSPAGDGHHFREFFQPYPPSKMISYPVSGMVNSPKNEGYGCMKTVDLLGQGEG